MPILFAINLLTFILFFIINTPDDMARMHLGQKHVTQESINHWKESRGYALPLFYDKAQSGIATFTHTLFYQKSVKLFYFDFGVSDQGRDIGYDIKHRMGPSLAIALPAFIIGLMINILGAILLVFFRDSILDVVGSIFCIVLMSISSLFYIIVGQYFFSKVMRLVPISGYDDGLIMIKFVTLPVIVSIASGLGAGVRWYRMLLLEELTKDYVKTARAKGLSEAYVLVKHVLRNALLPILTGVVVIIPSLFMGSLILESFFGIPGLGSYVIDAILQQDFAIVRAMVFLGSVLYILGLVLTDIAYVYADPRVRLS